ncbi:low-specificity D-threonine aldolase [Olavius sp. associated proteobacterium Delta 1]|nr:low-specificity D-threonine aldolase [Olavius sp. associated proteobacterium Delta 1]
MRIEELKTPAFLIDLPKLKANVQMMKARAQKNNVNLRPHVKTHKTAEIAKMQTAPEAPGITVSTLAEARFYQKSGFKDISYAFPITANKLSEAAELSASLNVFNILLDQPQTLSAVEEYGREHGIKFKVFLKVDCGYHRAGVDPSKPASVQLARQLAASDYIDFRGILTHAGHSYHCSNPAEIVEVARQERDVMAQFAEQLQNGGIACDTVSVGSTPTAMHAPDWQGVTEIRPGNYVFFDKFQADIGSCRPEQVAATVLTTVAAHYPAHNQMLIDAGALALSKDLGADHLGDEIVFGAVLNHPRLRLFSICQEHGLITSNDPIAFEKHPVGSLLQIIPNHSCLTAALFPKYHVVEEDQVVDEWTPMRGW